MENMKKAKCFEDMMGVFSPFPLGKSQQNFYVDTSKERSVMNARENIVNSFSYGINPYMKILFMGHKGCGKTTEIMNISEQLKDRYCIVNFSVAKETEIVGLEYVDVIFLIMEQLIEFVSDHTDIPLQNDLLESIASYWKQEKIYETVHITAAQFEAEGQAKISLLKKLFVGVKGILKSGNETKTQIREHVEPSLGALIQLINATVGDINNKLKERENKELLVIVEDMDKLDTEEARNIFVMHRKSLTSLELKMLFSFPIFMVYTPDFSMIQDDFDDCFFYSMIKVQESDRTKYLPGIQVLKEIVWKRMDQSLIEEEVLDFLVLKSGGAIRDLFKMLRNAALYNLSHREKDQIDRETANVVVDMLKSEYMRNVTSDEQYEKLLQVYQDPVQKSTDPQLAELLQTQSVIEYNGKRWLGVHPVLVDFLKEKDNL